MEILCPSSNMAHIQVAIDNHAGAVYGGLKNWNARNKAINFSEEEYEVLIKKLHEHNIKFYLTLNILMLDNEIEDVITFLKKHTLPDSFIVTDIGLIETLKKNFPSVPLHFSTQFGSHSIDDVNFVEHLGGNRAILARELTLEEINKIKEKTNIELECFIWGSQCLSFSGLCFFGTLFCGGGGNRGKCIITCRDMYSINEEKGHYLYVPDMNCINLISKMKDIDCLKLEGRRRDPKEIEKILQSINKGEKFNENVGYLNGISLNENHLFEKINTRTKPVTQAQNIPSIDSNDACILYKNGIPVKVSNDYENKDVYYIYTEIKKDWDYKKRNITLDLSIENEEITSMLYVNYKGDGHTFLSKKNDELISITIDELFTQINQLNSDINLYKLKYKKNISNKYYISKELYNEMKNYINNDTLCLKPKELKHQLLIKKLYIEVLKEEWIEELINNPFVKIIYNISTVEKLKNIQNIIDKYSDNIIYKLPLFNFKSEELLEYYKKLENKEVMFTRYSQLYKTKDISFKKKYIDYTVYVWNKATLNFLKNFGITEFTASPELSYEDNSKIFEQHNTQFFVGGRLPLVYTRNCFRHLYGCQECKKSRLNKKTIKNEDKNLNFSILCEEDYRMLVNNDLFLNDYSKVDFKKGYTLRYVPLNQNLEEVKQTIKLFQASDYYQSMKKDEIWKNAYECNLFQSRS